MSGPLSFFFLFIFICFLHKNGHRKKKKKKQPKKTAILFFVRSPLCPDSLLLSASACLLSFSLLPPLLCCACMLTTLLSFFPPGLSVCSFFFVCSSADCHCGACRGCQGLAQGPLLDEELRLGLDLGLVPCILGNTYQKVLLFWWQVRRTISGARHLTVRSIRIISYESP